MARVVAWKALSGGLTRLLSSRHVSQDAGQRTPRILAIVPKGPNQHLLQEISQETGWILTFSETPPSIRSGRRAEVPPIILYDRELSPHHWHEIVSVLTKVSPRPYLILLSPNADTNLWDELQRVGGSDILRTPVNRDNMLWAVKRAWLLWRNQQCIRFPSLNRQ
jgi:hypothetical protein